LFDCVAIPKRFRLYWPYSKNGPVTQKSGNIPGNVLDRLTISPSIDLFLPMTLDRQLKDLESSAASAPNVQETAVTLIRDAFRLTRVTVMLYDKPDHVLQASASTGHPNKDMRSIRCPVLRMEGISSRAVESRAFLENRSIVIRDRRPDPEYRVRRRFPHKNYAREFAVFPLRHGARKLGVLAVAIDHGVPTKLTPVVTRRISALCQTLGSLIHATLPRRPAEGDVMTLIKDILKNNLLYSVYQPIVDIVSGRVHGYESLMRVDHPAIRDTQAVIGYSEKFNLYRDLSHLTNRNALRALRRLGPDQKLFLNLHPNDFREYATLSDRSNPFYRKDLSRLVFELTERHYVKDPERLNSQLKFFKAFGVGIAIDDLGSGYSSLEMLTRLEPDYIKLDMSLIRQIHQNVRQQKLIRSLLYYGEQIGCQCIAEGVETREELDELKAMGCRLIQGFCLAHPSEMLVADKEIQMRMRDLHSISAVAEVL